MMLWDEEDLPRINADRRGSEGKFQMPENSLYPSHYIFTRILREGLTSTLGLGLGSCFGMPIAGG